MFSKNYRGIPYISKDRHLRIDAIGKFLAFGNYDVVVLQEVWTEGDYELIKKNTENTFSYTHYFYRFVGFLIDSQMFYSQEKFRFLI